MATAVSKNQRSGPKQAQRKHLCAAGHEQVFVMTMLRRPSFDWQCACTGYEPIDTRMPYKSQTAKIKAPGSKARIWFETL